MKTNGMRSWNLNADNLEASVSFYRDLLGGEVQMTHQIRGVDVTRIKLGDSSIGLFDAASGPSDGVPHHTFEIEGPDDPEELKRELEGRGQTVTGIRKHGEGPGYSVYLDDPSGNHVELSRNG